MSGGLSPRTYEVALSPRAERVIERDLPEADAIAVVDFLYGPLAEDHPYRVGKPLRLEFESARRGQYRGIYAIHDDQVLVRVVRISHRHRVPAARTPGL